MFDCFILSIFTTQGFGENIRDSGLEEGEDIFGIISFDGIAQHEDRAREVCHYLFGEFQTIDWLHVVVSTDHRRIDAGNHREGFLSIPRRTDDFDFGFEAGRERRLTPADDEALAAVGDAFVGMEVVDTRLADFKQAHPEWLLADNQMNHALVIGSSIKGWRTRFPVPILSR